MSTTRKYYSPKIKAEVAVEAIKETHTQSQLASQYGIHPSQIKQWKQQGLDSLKYCFSNQQAKADKEQEKLLEKLYQEIGYLHSQLNWLKKKHRTQQQGEA